MAVDPISIFHIISGAVFGHVSKKNKVDAFVAIFSGVALLVLVSAVGIAMGLNTPVTKERIFFTIAGIFFGQTLLGNGIKKRTEREIKKAMRRVL